MASRPSNTLEAVTPGVSQVIALSGSSTQAGAAVGSQTQVVRLVATVACWVKSSANPTATNDGTSMYVPANVPVLMGVNPNEKIAAIGTTGSLYITEAN